MEPRLKPTSSDSKSHVIAIASFATQVPWGRHCLNPEEQLSWDHGTPASGRKLVFRWGQSEALHSCSKVSTYRWGRPQTLQNTGRHPPTPHLVPCLSILLYFTLKWTHDVSGGGRECKINATFSRPRSKGPASYGNLQFCLRSYNVWVVAWCYICGKSEACEDFVLFS